MNIIDRLLASREPSIRFNARRYLMDEDVSSTPMRALRAEIRDSSRVKALLKGRNTRGELRRGRSVYVKWQGAHWVLASLAELGYPPGDPSLLPIAQQLLDTWLADVYFEEFEATSKARSYKGHGVPIMEGRHRRCAAQQAYALLSLTTLELADARSEQLVERLLHWQWPDGGWNCDRDPKASCSSFMETLIPLRALNAWARAQADNRARVAAERAAEVLLARKLYKRRRDGAVISHSMIELHYPLYWHYDILGGLKALVELGAIDDPRCCDALDLLESKRLPDGGFPAEARYYKKVSPKAVVLGAEQVDWGGTSKRHLNEWVTLDALRVLRAAGRS